MLPLKPASRLFGFNFIFSKKIFRAREYPLVCKPLEASPITASPGLMLRPSNIFDFSTTPTIVPLTSYSPG